MKLLAAIALLFSLAACADSDARTLKVYAGQRDSCVAAGSDVTTCGIKAYGACVADSHWKGDASTASAKCEEIGPGPLVSPS